MKKSQAANRQDVNDNHFQQTKVLALNDNHSHPANNEKPTTKLGKSTLNFSNQDWQVDKIFFVYFSKMLVII